MALVRRTRRWSPPMVSISRPNGWSFAWRATNGVRGVQSQPNGTKHRVDDQYAGFSEVDWTAGANVFLDRNERMGAWEVSMTRKAMLRLAPGVRGAGVTAAASATWVQPSRSESMIRGSPRTPRSLVGVRSSNGSHQGRATRLKCD